MIWPFDLPEPSLSVDCPKCKVPAGQPCTSILHDGPLTTRFYTAHKKRRAALYVEHRVLSAKAVPVRPALHGLPVGAVDSAARGLESSL